MNQAKMREIQSNKLLNELQEVLKQYKVWNHEARKDALAKVQSIALTYMSHADYISLEALMELEQVRRRCEENSDQAPHGSIGDLYQSLAYL